MLPKTVNSFKFCQNFFFSCLCNPERREFKKNGICVPHSACPAGEGVFALGTPFIDTICVLCSNGFESPSVSTTEKCYLMSR